MSRRCAECRGNLMRDADRLYCLLCGRSPSDLVTLADALVCIAEPDAVSDIGPRQTVPLSISLARAAAWSRGEAAP